MFLVNYLLTNSKREAVLSTQADYNLSLQAIGLFWAWNVFDIFYFKKNEFFWTLNLHMSPERSSTLYAEHNNAKPRIAVEINFRF